MSNPTTPIIPETTEPRHFQALRSKPEAPNGNKRQKNLKPTLENQQFWTAEKLLATKKNTAAVDREPRKPLGFAPSGRNQRRKKSKVTLESDKPSKYRLILRELREDGSIAPEIYHQETISEAQAVSGQYIPKLIHWNSQRTDSGLLPLVSKLEKLGGEA